MAREEQAHVLRKAKQYRDSNKEAALAANRKYRSENSERLREYSREYRRKHKDALRKKKRAYRKERAASDPVYALSVRIRDLIAVSIRNGGYTKKSRTLEILGCGHEEFKRHIERQFVEGMNWENRSAWQIDHSASCKRKIRAGCFAT